MPCCCGSRRSPPTRARPRRRRPWPARRSTWRPSRRSAALTAWTRCWPAACWWSVGRGARRSATRWCARPSTTTSRGTGAGRCTGSWPSCSEARGEPRSEVAAHWLAAREPERALDALVEPSASSRPCTPTATPRALAARRWSCGPTASAAGSGWRCSTATPAPRSLRATPPTRRARCGSSSRPARRAPVGRSPRRSGGWRRSTSCRATASTRWRRAGTPPRPSPRTGSPARPRPSGSSPPRTCRRRPSTAPRSSWRCSRARRRSARAASTCAHGPSGWPAWRGPSAASSTRAWRPSAPAWRWRSSTG